MTSPSFRGGFLVLIGATLWSSGGIAIKLLEGYSPLTISAGRATVCALFFGVLLRGRVVPQSGVRRWVFAGGVAYAAVIMTFVYATKWTTAANAILLQYTAPVWIAAIMWLVARERPRARDAAAMVLGGIGVLLCMQEGLTWFSGKQDFSRTLFGDLLALCSGLSFALITMLLHHVNRVGFVRGDETRYTALWCLFYGNVLAALVGVPALVSELGMPGIPGYAPVTGWALIGWLGAFQLGLGYWFYQRGLRTTRALAASLIGLIEPALNPVWVAWFFGEIPARASIIGGVLVVCAVVALLTRRPRAPVPAGSSQEAGHV